MWSKEERIEWEQMKARVLSIYEQNRADYLHVCKALGTGFYGSNKTGNSQVGKRKDY